MPLPPNKSLISCKWIFKNKLLANWTVERYKACLVAKEFDQIEGVDYLETFIPILKKTTIWNLVSLAASNKWYLEKLDVNTISLHGDLNEDVYMKIPPGLKVSNKSLVCKLNRYI